MMKVHLSFLFLFLFLLIDFDGAAQDSPIHQKIIYAEFLGNAEIYSLNMEYMLKTNQSIRAGISWMPGTFELSGLNDRSWMYFPLEYNYLIGKRNHKMDLSGGLIAKWTLYDQFPNQMVLRPQLRAGYRYQRNKKGLFLRSGIVLFTPLFLSIDRQETFFYTANHWLFWPSIGAGYSF